jgi:O-antigen ligase
MTFLARMGVPGLVLWALVQGAWAVGIMRAYLHSRLVSNGPWSGLFLFLGAYWMAHVINASFDVFLEGPMGGIWFWTIYGVGLAAMRIYRVRPEVLAPSKQTHRDEVPNRLRPALRLG